MCVIINNNINVEKQLSGGVLWKECLRKFRNIQRKSSVFESLFNKVASIKATGLLKREPNTMFFRVNIAKFLRTVFL